jgi:hypothetical protein
MSLRAFFQNFIPNEGMGMFIVGCAEASLREDIILENASGQKSAATTAKSWNEARRIRDSV